MTQQLQSSSQTQRISVLFNSKMMQQFNMETN